MLAVSLFLVARESGALSKDGDQLLMNFQEMVMNSFENTRQMATQAHLSVKTDLWSLSKSKMVPYWRMSAHWEGTEFHQDALDVGSVSRAGNWLLAQLTLSGDVSMS